MILCFDVGNTQIYGGLFLNKEIVFKFRHDTKGYSSADQIGLFLKMVLRENGHDPSLIKNICLCTVVPHLTYSLTHACKKYFNIDPYVLGPGSKTGLKINYQNPSEVGADRIANAIAAENLFPSTNKIIVDTGTATTFCAINSQREYLGGIILPGVRISMLALEEKTAKLPSVEIIKKPALIGRTTVASIQSGLYYSHAFTIKGIISEMKKQAFEANSKVVTIGTGGFSNLFDEDQLFDFTLSDLVLNGLYLVLQNEKLS